MLIPPQYINPYGKRGKSNAIDTEAICEAVSRPVLGLDPGMRFVPVKTVEPQAALTMLGVRDLLVKQRTVLINAICGHAAEFDVSVAQSLSWRKRGEPRQVTELVQRLASDEGAPALAREMVDQAHSSCHALAKRGRPHMESRVRGNDE